MSQKMLARVPTVRRALAALVLALSVSGLAGAAQRGAPQPPPPAAPPTPRATAPLELTGYWVSVVTEDWRWRMMTPAKGDAPGVPPPRRIAYGQEYYRSCSSVQLQCFQCCWSSG